MNISDHLDQREGEKSHFYFVSKAVSKNTEVHFLAAIISGKSFKC